MTAANPIQVRKHNEMRPYAAELGRAGIDYRPITFSCYGRPHEQSISIIRQIAKRKARRRRTESHVEERRIMNKVTMEIWRRGAGIVGQCWVGTRKRTQKGRNG